MAKQQQHVAFSGTREGMSDEQMGAVREQLAGRFAGWIVHHGCCVGADEQAHMIALALGLPIIGHPPHSLQFRSTVYGYDKLREPAAYLIRNRYMIDECAELVATPGGPEITHSGTWSTVRYARRHRRCVSIIWPDGSLEFLP